MEEWDDKFFVSLVKKRRYDDMEGVEDSSTCVTALLQLLKTKKKKKTEKDVKRRLLLDNCWTCFTNLFLSFDFNVAIKSAH